MNSIKYLSIVVLMISSTRMACIGADATTDPDLATPQATVLSYCKHGVFDLKSKYFSFPKNRASRAQTEKFTWRDCRVISTTDTHLSGQVADGTLVQPGDREVLLEVKEPNDKGVYIISKYWFLLSRFKDGWKIISYSVVGIAD